MNAKAINGFLWCIAIVALVASCTESNNEETQDTLLIAAGRGKLLFGRRVVYAVDIKGKFVDVKVPDGMDYEPEWSPDGLWITYSKAIGASGATDIFLLRADGQSKPVQVTNSPFRDAMSPRWSPDGKQIAYYAYSGNGYSIYLLDIECILKDLKCSPSTKFLVDGDFPSWSPDGKKIVYSHRGAKGISVTDVDNINNTVTLIKDSNRCLTPEWSPDGLKIAFVCDGKIYIVNPDGSNITNLISGGFFLKWSPNGNKIVFVGGKPIDANLGQQLDLEGMVTSTALFTMDSTGKEVKRITPYNDENIGWFAWVPRK